MTLFSSKRFSDASFKHEALPLSNSNSSNETPQLHAIITNRTEYDLCCRVPDRWRPPGILVSTRDTTGDLHSRESSHFHINSFVDMVALRL